MRHHPEHQNRMEPDYSTFDSDTNMTTPGQILDSDDEDIASSAAMAGPSSAYTQASGAARTRKKSIRTISRPRNIPSSPMASTIPHNLLPSAPASPPTPAPSPGPSSRAPDWSTAAEHEDDHVRHVRALFVGMNDAEKQRLLAELLNMCNSHQLGFVHDFVSPRLKKDPFTTLPNELCLRILTFIDDPQTLARSSQVSRRWRELVSDDMAWKSLCEKHAYRRLSNEANTPTNPLPLAAPINPDSTHAHALNLLALRNPQYAAAASSAPDLLRTQSLDRSRSNRIRRRPKATSYRSHFKQRWMVETAWRTGGKCDTKQITPDVGVVTSLHLTDKYIVFAMDNAKIHVFDTDGAHQQTLQGHVMGVWAMVPWDDILVSGGCDRDVRVWNMATGLSVHTLRGHTSTVRCIKMADANTAISGSRDTTLRIWDIQKGVCKHVLLGHQASVRCLDIHGDIVVSGSYDTTARMWSISEGKCLRVLNGHFSQIYAVAYDGKKIATGSLDTSVRIWNPADGKCLAILQGHTSLVGQLQLRGNTLVTGGSDGSVRVWSLEQYAPIHRLAAHDNSVTSLQFDDVRIVSGGSDGRVKIWDTKTGALVRELSVAESVWRVVFEEEKAVVMANRGQKTVMEVWDFSPPDEEDIRSSSPMSMPDQAMGGYHTLASAPSLISKSSRSQPDVVMRDVLDEAANLVEDGDEID